MRRTLGTAVATLTAAIGLAAGAVGVAATADAAPGAHGQRVCADARAGEATCLAEKLVDANGRGVAPDRARPSNAAKKPAQIQDAYKITGLTSGGRTVAI